MKYPPEFYCKDHPGVDLYYREREFKPKRGPEMHVIEYHCFECGKVTKCDMRPKRVHTPAPVAKPVSFWRKVLACFAWIACCCAVCPASPLPGCRYDSAFIAAIADGTTSAPVCSGDSCAVTTSSLTAQKKAKGKSQKKAKRGRK